MSRNGVADVLLRVIGVGVLTPEDVNKKGSEKSLEAVSMLHDELGRAEGGLEEVEVEGRSYAGGGDIPSSVYRKSI